MKFNILTIFPEMFADYLSSSLLGKAVEKGLLEFNVINIRDFSTDKHHKVDDAPYGGGAGMVMMPEPLFLAVESLALAKKNKVIYTSPQGKVFDQKTARQLSQEDEITIICGRYEGIDQRVIETLVTDEYSIGDYVLTGGELPSLVMIDAIARMIKGVVGREESVINDSFYEDAVFDCPHYTRPAEFRGLTVPAVLLNGHHAEIEKWRQEIARKKTRLIRPELGEKNDKSKN